MSINTRDELIQWALRSLGHPMITINVTVEQLEDRLDDSLELFAEYHLEANQREYLRYQITEEDLYNQYIPLDGSSILGIQRLIPFTNLLSGHIGDSMSDLPFDPLYLLMSSQSSNGWNAFDLTSYSMFREYAETIQLLLKPRHNIRYKRLSSKLYIDWAWPPRDHRKKVLLGELPESEITQEQDDESAFQFEEEATGSSSNRKADVQAGDIIILEVFKILDPEEATLIYNERWLKEYFSQKVKMQWAVNISKYASMTLPGGVQLDGRSMMQEAQVELDKMKEELIQNYGEPLQMMIG